MRRKILNPKFKKKNDIREMSTSEEVSHVLCSSLIAKQNEMRRIAAVAELEDEALIADDGQHIHQLAEWVT